MIALRCPCARLINQLNETEFPITKSFCAKKKGENHTCILLSKHMHANACWTRFVQCKANNHSDLDKDDSRWMTNGLHMGVQTINGLGNII